MCNQNRVDCGKLAAVKKYCEELRNTSQPERYNQTFQNGSIEILETLGNKVTPLNESMEILETVVKNQTLHNGALEVVETSSNKPIVWNGSMEQLGTSAKYTICNKMSVSENKSIIDYLFDQGKCGDICRDGKVYYFRFSR